MHGAGPVDARLLGRKPELALALVSRKTYEIEDSGPYGEDEVREKIRAYCDGHGFIAASTLTVVEMTDDGGRPVDASQFLDGR